ncbi:hypothetical protein MF271_00910 (plasmid) [Deinococcus sp. KNUC1210]|uniref:hypothetical protein n=1 Tax=Deinococcus sp. KNUC1210 TaxID=2917691 RepID=UPI001EF00E66|nr:hypothetical protein [Deinococcus sp. KNUC1210]ULH13922.1 hypothetical protein MF271_00910 [Deinococcus sp. KNUC1210]
MTGLDTWMLLTGLCMSALGLHWTDEVQRTLLSIVLHGLMPSEAGRVQVNPVR